jgi:hypothetical protein
VRTAVFSTATLELRFDYSWVVASKNFGYFPTLPPPSWGHALEEQKLLKPGMVEFNGILASLKKHGRQDAGSALAFVTNGWVSFARGIGNSLGQHRVSMRRGYDAKIGEARPT